MMLVYCVTLAPRHCGVRTEYASFLGTSRALYPNTLRPPSRPFPVLTGSSEGEAERR